MNKFIVFYIFFAIILFYSCTYEQKQNTKECKYIYKGTERSSFFQIDDSIVASQKLNIDIVKNPLIASKIAYLVISEVYGEEVAIQEQPYYITLINSNCWIVSGNVHSKKEGGTFTIYIGKKDAKIYRIWHGK